MIIRKKGFLCIPAMNCNYYSVNLSCCAFNWNEDFLEPSRFLKHRLTSKSILALTSSSSLINMVCHIQLFLFSVHC